MGRFARHSEREAARADHARVAARPRAPGWPRSASREPRALEDRGRPDRRTPSEMKYFVLAIAALIGLGVGWLSGKAITSQLPSPAEPAVALEEAVPATFEASSQSSPSTPSAEDAEDAEAANAKAAAPDADSADGPAAAVTQVATDDSPARGGRRVARHAAMRRAGRGNIFARPFKALRKFRIW